MLFGDERPEGKSSPSVRAALAAVAFAVILIIAAGAYNAAQAPAGAHSYQAQVSALSGGPQVREVPLAGPTAAVGTHHIFDAAAGRFFPLDGSAAFSASTEGAVDPVAHGDAYAWFDAQGHLRIRDMFLGTDVDKPVAPAASPLPGTLALSARWAAWNHIKDDLSVGIYGFDRNSATFRSISPPVAGNVSLLAVSGSDFYLTGANADDPLWVFNASTSGLFDVGNSSNLTRPQGGAFFAAWVNLSVPQVEYYDAPNRAVRILTAPEGVLPSWVRVDNYRVLFGGLKPGFIFASNQVELYDFATGNAQRYDNLGVDLENHSRLSLGGNYLVALNEVIGPRPPAPLTPVLLGAAVVALVVAALLAARASFREPE